MAEQMLEGAPETGQLILLGKTKDHCVTGNHSDPNPHDILWLTETEHVSVRAEKQCGDHSGNQADGVGGSRSRQSTSRIISTSNALSDNTDSEEKSASCDVKENETCSIGLDDVNINVDLDLICIDKPGAAEDDCNDIQLGSNDREQKCSALKIEIDVDFNDCSGSQMPKKPKNSLQEAFLHFRKKRQDDIKQERKRRDAILLANADPARMEALRKRVIERARSYFGVPYARKYWSPDTPEYNSRLFLDCCGLVRQVIRDMKKELGFRLGPWNQAYMYDTLPITVRKSQLKPGDLVFMKGNYVNPKTKKQPHNMTHVEIWLGDGDKTIGSRWNKGKVQEFTSYKFDPKSFQNERYIFKSIDTWLMGVCRSCCAKHPWRLTKYNPTTKSIFHTQLEAETAMEDQKANADSDDNEENVDDNDNGNDSWKTKRQPQGAAATKKFPPEDDDMTPRSHVTDSSGVLTSNPPGSSLSTPRRMGGSARGKPIGSAKVDARKVKPAQSPYEINANVLNDGSASGTQGKNRTGTFFKAATPSQVGKMASQALKRKTTKPPKTTETASKMDSSRSSSMIPVVSSCNKDELRYIPNNLPGRSQWMTSKERERKIKKERDEAIFQTNQRGLVWNFYPSEMNPTLAVKGSRDIHLSKTHSCPNFRNPASALKFRSDTNLCYSDKSFIKESTTIASMKKQTPINVVEGTNTDSGVCSRESSASGLSIVENSTRPSGATHPLENCLIVMKSPSVMDNDKGRKLESREKSVPSSPSVQVLRQIRQKHMPAIQTCGAFSLIKEEGSSISAAAESTVVADSLGLTKQIKSSTPKTDLQDVVTQCGDRPCTFAETMIHENAGFEAVNIDLGALNFSEEVVLETARLTEYEDKADDNANTSFCSDLSIEDLLELNAGACHERDYSNSLSDNSKKMTPSSDIDTDDELDKALNLNFFNHRCVSRDGLRCVQNIQVNPAWEWLHTSDMNQGFLNSNNNSSNEPYGFHTINDDMLTNEDDLDIGHDDDDDCDDELVVVGSRMSSERVFRRHAALPPISSPASPEIAPSSAPPIHNEAHYPDNGSNVHGGKRKSNNQSQGSSQVALTTIPPVSKANLSWSDFTEYELVRSQDAGDNDLLTRFILNQRPRGSDDSDSSVNDQAMYRASNQRPGSCPYTLDSSTDAPSPRSHYWSSAFPRETLDVSSVDEDWFDTRANSLTAAASSTLQGEGSRTNVLNIISDTDLSETDLRNNRYGKGTLDKIPEDQLCRQHRPDSNMQMGPLDSAGIQDGDDELPCMNVHWDIQFSLLRLEGQRRVTTKGVVGVAGSDNKGAGGDGKKGGGEGRKGGEDDKGHEGGDGADADGGKGKDSSSHGAGGQGGGAGGGGGVGGGGGTGGGGGGGNKKPPGGRSSKLPQCSLPNNMQPTFFIGGGNGTALVEAPLLSLGWKRITDKFDERFRLKWVECKSKINYTTFKEGEQLVNHIPNCKLLTNKMGLLCSLQEYERVTLLTKGRPPRLKMADFVPETYKLDERVDREKFLNEYKDGEVWICKPTGMNQGKGIFLLRSRQEIDQLLLERDAKSQAKAGSRPPMMRIVQRYIHNPLLLDGRKFDIRAYMLIASTVPYLLLFHQGYVRLSCIKYDNDDTNLTTHLTNQYVQKKDPSYKDLKEDTAWTMDKFNDYINQNVAKSKGIDQDWVYGSLTKQMQRIILHCFNSVKHKIQCKIGYFDLYGMDFMIDTDMKVWLIEINVNPALHTNCEALKEAIPCVVEESLFVAIECFDKSRKGQPLMPLNSLRGFNVLYCGNSPNAVAPRQTRSVSPSKDGTEKTRPTGTAPTARRASPPRNLPRMSSNTTQMTSGPTPGTAPAVTQATTNKKMMASSTLPTINIGATIIQKPAPGATNSTAKQSPYQTQPYQVQPESITTGDDHKFRMTHADSSLKRNRDYSNRGN